MIEISEEFLASVLGTDAGEITEALKDGDSVKPQDEVEAWIKSKYDEAIYRAKKSGHTEGHGRGLRESLTSKERELKEKFGVEGKTIDEVIDNVIGSVQANSKASPDDVKNSEVYINETKRLKAIIAEKEAELEGAKSSFTKAETLRAARAHGEKLLKAKNYVLPDDEEIANTLVSTLFEKLEDDNTRLSLADGRIVVLDKDGRPKENESGTKDLTFDDLFEQKARKFFKVAAADDRKSPANKKTEGDDPKPAGDMPELKSRNDLITELNKLKGDPDKMQALKAHYDKLVEDGQIKE
jgi:hypothetical protein